MSALKDFLSLTQFTSQFKELHAKARTGRLEPSEREAYEHARGDLARMLVFAQQLSRRPGETFRQALRVPMALDVVIEPSGNAEKSVTIDVSTGGFATLLATPRTPGASVGFWLRTIDGASVTGRARVVASTPRDDAFRVSFAMKTLDEKDIEHLEVLAFDWVLAQLDLVPAGG